MTTAPTSSTPRRPAPPALTPGQVETRRQLELMGYGPGAIELVAGTNRSGNPDKIDLLTYAPKQGRPWTTRTWVESEGLADLAQKAERLAEKWGNVYISVGTCGKAENPHKPGKLGYDRRATLPRRCLVADDVTDLDALPLPPTWATETSPGNYQVGYTCGELLTPAQAERLAAGLALLVGADPSGSDATQLVRLAGTLNTKPKCAGSPGDPANGIEPEGWRVRLRAEGPRYSKEELARAFLPGGLAELRGVSGGGSRRTGGKVAYDRAAWENLPDGEALMGSARYQGFFKSRPQLAALLKGQRITLITRQGPDDTGNQQVAVLVSNLLTVGRRNEAGDFVPGLGAPSLDEIRAVAMHWQPTLRPGFDLDRYKADIDGLLRPAPDGYQPAGYAPEPTRSLAGATVSLPTLEPAQQPGPGRPAGQRADNARRLAELLAARVGDEVKRPKLAAALGLKVRQVANLLTDLQAAPWVDLELRRTRYGLRVVRCAINSPAPDVQSLPEVGAGDGVSTPNSVEGVQESTHRPPCTPELVAEAAGAVASVPASGEHGPVEDGSSSQGQAGGVCSPYPAPLEVVPPRPAETPEAWAARTRAREERLGVLPACEYLKWEKCISSAPPYRGPQEATQTAIFLPDPELADLAAVLEGRDPGQPAPANDSPSVQPPVKPLPVILVRPRNQLGRQDAPAPTNDQQSVQPPVKLAGLVVYKPKVQLRRQDAPTPTDDPPSVEPAPVARRLGLDEHQAAIDAALANGSEGSLQRWRREQAMGHAQAAA